MAINIDREYIPTPAPEPAPTPATIDDTTTSNSKTWSSEKISSEIPTISDFIVNFAYDENESKWVSNKTFSEVLTAYNDVTKRVKGKWTTYNGDYTIISGEVIGLEYDGDIWCFSFNSNFDDTDTSGAIVISTMTMNNSGDIYGFTKYRVES